jgi:hypothetical protein
MTARMSKRKVAAAAGAIVVIGAASIAAVIIPGSAAAKAESQIRTLSETGLSGAAQRNLERIAESSGIRASDVREVAAKGDGPARAGLYVGKDSGGNEFVSFFAPRGFSGFADARKLTASTGKMMFVASASQPGTAGQTGHVQIRGVADSTVAGVELELADGTRLPAELIRLTGGANSFFTYVSDDPTSFPNVVRAFDSQGGNLSAWDVSREIRAPNAK